MYHLVSISKWFTMKAKKKIVSRKYWMKFDEYKSLYKCSPFLLSGYKYSKDMQMWEFRRSESDSFTYLNSTSNDCCETLGLRVKTRQWWNIGHLVEEAPPGGVSCRCCCQRALWRCFDWKPQYINEKQKNLEKICFDRILTIGRILKNAH